MPPDHDQLFKKLLRAFFGDLLFLVVPGIADRLDTGRASFLDKELLADAGKGRREADLLARVPVYGGGSLLVHVEIEARARSRMPYRLRSYASRIQATYPGQVLSILLNLRGGRAGVHHAAIDGELSGPELSPFRYVVFGLAGCSSASYLAREEPLAWALAALMRPEGGRAAHKLACQRRIGDARLSDERRILLIDCLEAYLELTPEEAQEYKILSAQNPREATAVWMTWSERMKAEGKKEGRRLGKQEGRLEGRLEGVRSLQQILIFQLEQRFGPLPAGVHRQVEAIESLRRLTRLAERVLIVGSLRELRLR
jgi:predicted transposase YdaD